MAPWLYLLCLTTLVTLATTHWNCKHMTTFNAGLVSAIPLLEQRRPLVRQALKESTADFICLQEVWFEEDMAAILEEVESKFPHHYSKIHAAPNVLRPPLTCHGRHTDISRPKDISCDLEESKLLEQGITTYGVKNGCFNLEGYQQGLCVLAKCRHVFNNVDISVGCISCVFLNSASLIPAALKICTTPKEVHNRINAPGLLVLSKTELSDVSYTPFFPDNNLLLERGYIEAKMADGKQIACTHLSAFFPIYMEYDSKLTLTSYKDQNRHEIMKLLAKFWETQHILMGDFNTGPKLAVESDPRRNLEGELPENYDVLTGFGYRSPYMEQDGRCTWCRTNPLTGNSSNNVIDHVMMGAYSQHTTPFAMRAFDKGSPKLSDHYGVTIQVCDC